MHTHEGEDACCRLTAETDLYPVRAGSLVERRMKLSLNVVFASTKLFLEIKYEMKVKV